MVTIIVMGHLYQVAVGGSVTCPRSQCRNVAKFIL